MDSELNYTGLSNLFNSIREKQEAYLDTLYTERLLLKRETSPDFTSVDYSILLKDSLEQIGEVILLFDGEIWYKILEPFRSNGYATEAVSKLIGISKFSYFYLSIDYKNIPSKKVANKLGFTYKRKNGKSLLYEKLKNWISHFKEIEFNQSPYYLFF